MLPGADAGREARMDSNADFLGRERFASLNCYSWARREPGSYPNGFRKSSRQQTQRCNRVCCIRFRRRDCARRVLNLRQKWT